MENDPLERIAVALVEEIRARRTPTSDPVSLPQNSPEGSPIVTNGAPRVRTARKRERRAALYPAHYSLRVTDEDRDRFDAYAERYKLTRGELFRRMLDALDILESEREK